MFSSYRVHLCCMSNYKTINMIKKVVLSEQRESIQTSTNFYIKIADNKSKKKH